MPVLAQVFAALAALLHALIFVMESLLFTRPAIYGRFGLKSQQDAETVRPMAYNQGFYNLFLAIGALAGLALLLWAGLPYAGRALVLFTMASMTAAAVVLTTTGAGYLRAALIQGTLPLIGFVLFLFA